MLTNLKDHSVIRLKDGREATILISSADGSLLEVDFGLETSEIETVSLDQVESVIWEP